jgi:hypothetical protein
MMNKDSEGEHSFSVALEFTWTDWGNPWTTATCINGNISQFQNGYLMNTSLTLTLHQPGLIQWRKLGLKMRVDVIYLAIEHFFLIKLIPAPYDYTIIPHSNIGMSS